MLLNEAVERLNTLLRPGLAESWDKTGLLIGDPQSTVRRVGIALDPCEAVLAEAGCRKLDLLVTHHPLYLRAPESLVLTHRNKGIYQLIRAGIALYCAHTNFDALPWGMARELCRRLGLEAQRSFAPTRIMDRKVVTFVPHRYAEKVRAALADAGAGRIGAYAGCAFVTAGEGSFTPQLGAHPYVGRVGKTERAGEDRLEMVVAGDRVTRAIAALRQAHPYEEPAIDVVPMETRNERLGFGLVARVVEPAVASTWIKSLKTRLRTRHVEVWGYRSRKPIRTVALIPGAAGGLIHETPRE